MEKVLKRISAISTILIGVGSVKAFLYYHHFEIDIFSYLKPTEVIALFLSDLPVLVIIMGVFLVFKIFSLTETEIKEKEGLAKDYEKRKFWKRLLIYIKINDWLLFTGLYTVFFVVAAICTHYGWLSNIFSQKLDSRFYIETLVVLWLIPIISFTEVELRLKLKKLYKKDPSKEIGRFVKYCLFAFLILYLNVRGEIKAIENCDKHYGSTLTINDSDSTYQIKSDSTLFYLGKSENYVFFYDVNDTAGIVLPSQSITEYRIKKPLR